MDAKCPRCENEFEIDELVYGDDVKCQKCWLLIRTEYDEDEHEDEHGESYYECYGWSDDTPADCCKDCENLNLQSCVGICKVDSEN